MTAKFSFLKEKLLVARVLINRDAEAFGTLYNLYIESIYRFIYFKVSSVEEAEDITSEVFLKTWEYLNREKKVENFKALLYRIARNLVIDFYRQKGRQTQEIEELIENISGQQDLALKEKVEATLELERLEQQLRQLKDEYREIIILKYIEEFSIKEIAQILDKPKNNVRVLLYRATSALKEIIKQDESSKTI